MSQLIKVEKRLPFGFRGEWATLYKLYTYDDIQNNVVQYQNHNYLKIPTKLQVKTNTNNPKMRSIEQQVDDLENISTTSIIETTDAYFEVNKNLYKCVADTGDIINFRGEWWEITKIDIQVKYIPARREHYFLSIKKIDEEVIVW